MPDVPRGPRLARAAAPRRGHRLRRQGWAHEKQAPAGEGVWLSQAAARVPRVPTWCTPRGWQGPRPLGGSGAQKESVAGGAALTLVPGRLAPRFLEPPTRSPGKRGQHKQQRLRTAVVAARYKRARRSPASLSPKVVITSEQAPWPRGADVEQGVAVPPQLQVERLRRARPQLKGLERFWRGLRRRAPPNRWCASRAALPTTRRNNIS